MTQKEKAIVKAKMDKLQLTYLEAWKKQPDSEKIKAMWETISEVSIAFDRVCADADYYLAAATERDDKFYVTFEENARLKDQIEQQKEAIESQAKQLEEYRREYKP